MPKKRKDEDSVFIRGLLPYKDFINAMETKHRVPAVELGRGLFAAAAAFYNEHGWFAFPVKIEPEAFQARWVAEMQGKYPANTTGTEMAITELKRRGKRPDKKS